MKHLLYCLNLKYHYMFKVIKLSVTLNILLFSLDVFSQENASINACMTDSPVTVDGYLNEASWQKSTVVSDFIQFEPDEGKASSRKTEVRILFGKDDLYIGATMYDNEEDIENNLGRRDEYNRADWFMVSIDSYFNKKTAYTFAVNAAGVQLDGQQDDNKKLSTTDVDPLLPAGLDVSWDAIWFSDVRITDNGWIAEIRIPYSMLRYSRNELQTWGIHYTRRIPRLGRGIRMAIYSTKCKNQPCIRLWSDNRNQGHRSET